MKNSIEIRQERAELIGKADALLNLAKGESRDFTNDEQVSYDGMMENIDKLAKDIEVVERQEKLNAEIASTPVSFETNKNIVPKEARNYSVFKAVEGYLNGNMDGIEKEAHEQAVSEARSSGSAILGIGIPASMLESRAVVSEGSSSIAPTTLGAFQDGLRENAVYEQVGATILNGLSANTQIPVVGANNAAYAGTASPENVDGGDVGAQFSSLTLSPTRIAGYVDLSKQLILQSGSGAEQAIIRDLGRSVADAVNSAMFAESNVTGADTALFNVSGVNNVATTAFAAGSVLGDLLAMEQKVAESKGLAGNLAYVTNPALMPDMKKASLVTSVSAAMQGMDFNGYKTIFSNGCAKDASNSDVVTIFGDFSKLMVGHFGGLDITVDNFTQAHKAAVRLVINKYISFGLTHPAAFSRCLVEFEH